MKKVVNSVLASALALSVAPMVVGAEETAAPKMDANLEKVVKRLEALGLVQGYGNGEYGVDRQITRAEFATLVVRARGLESGAKLAQFNKYFKDVNSSDWFAGYVNVANGQEIIKGYEDKTFKAGNNVTYAEAVAMLVRALGYEPSVKGTWPNNYIAKASELGISKNVNIDANKAATRGDIFKMLDNSLTVDIMKQTSFGSNNDYRAVENVTLLSEYLDVEVYDMEWARTDDNEPGDLPFVSNVPVTGLGTLKGNEVEFSAPSNSIKGAKYKVADGINPNDFAGQHVQVWVKEGRENVVVWMEGSEDESVIKDTISDFYYNGKVVDEEADIKDINKLELSKLELEVGEGKKYDFADDAKVTFNFERFKNAEDALREVIAVSDAFSIKAVLNDSGEIAYLSVVDDRTADQSSRDYNKFGSEVIEKVDEKKITTLQGTNFDVKDKEEGKDYLVFLDGKPAKLADLKPMDVYSVYYADGNRDKYLIFANRTVVEGKIDEVYAHNTNDNRIKIGDKTYRFRKASFSEDGNDTVEDITQEDIRDLDGVEVKLYLDPTGRVRHIETKSDVNDRTFKAIVTKAAVYDQLEDKYSFNVYTEKGAKQTIKLEKEDIEKYVYNTTTKKGEFDEVTSAEALSLLTPKKDTPAVVEVSLDSKGEVDKVRIFNTAKGAGEGVREDEELTVGFLSNDDWDKAADEDDLVLTHNGQSYTVTDDTIVFDMTGEIKEGNRRELEDASTAKFKSIADDDDISVYYIVDEDDNEVDYAFVTAGDSISADKAYGLVKSVKTKSDGDTYVTFVAKVDNEVKEVEFKVDGDLDDADDADLKRANFVQYSLNGSNEVDPEDVVVIVDTQGEEPELTTVLEDAEDAELDFVTTGLITDVDGRTLKLEGLDKDGKKVTRTAVTSSATVYFDYTEKIDGVEEGDYVVLVDSDDDGSAIDYVMWITDEDEVEDYSYDMSDFLAQDDVVVTPPPTTGDAPKYAQSSATKKDVLIANQYTVAGQFDNYTDGTAKITVGTKTADVTIEEDGTFTVDVLVKKTEVISSYKLVLTQGGKEYTFNGNFQQ
ncbi:S-layer homology domain-containing protein [Brevibacillus dissolubilis]|uniref:S-layer homology domain-containing protein n=1 Tax=Brevibacillus dissolubilis TaxID=1844116 RepID=UPI0011164E36|nr:S-layer homology domain-containing protein [Brevibacillus dissolubilis]